MTPRPCPWVRDPTTPGALSNAARAAARWVLIYAPATVSEAQRAGLVDALRARRLEPEFALLVLRMFALASTRRERAE